jgi:hypothetical protein
MKTGRTSAATLGLVGGLALGAWIGAEMTTLHDRAAVSAEPAAVTAKAAEEPAAPATRAKRKRVVRAPRVDSGAVVVDAPAPESAPKLVMTIPVSAPELHQRMKPVLARGTKLPIAVEGFTSAEQFAALAHAARNTKVPFILLKHRVLTEGQSLEAAILASKPDIDAKTEALKAKGQARADILSLTSNSVASNN